MRYLDSELVDRHTAAEPMDKDTLASYQKMFNLSREELREVVSVLAKSGARSGRLHGRRHADAGSLAKADPLAV